MLADILKNNGKNVFYILYVKVMNKKVTHFKGNIYDQLF